MNYVSAEVETNSIAVFHDIEQKMQSSLWPVERDIRRPSHIVLRNKSRVANDNSYEELAKKYAELFANREDVAKRRALRKSYYQLTQMGASQHLPNHLLSVRYRELARRIEVLVFLKVFTLVVSFGAFASALAFMVFGVFPLDVASVFVSIAFGGMSLRAHQVKVQMQEEKDREGTYLFSTGKKVVYSR